MNVDNKEEIKNNAYEDFKDRISMPGRPQKLTIEEIEILRKQGRIGRHRLSQR